MQIIDILLGNKRRRLQKARVWVDGAIRPERGVSGLAAVVYDEHGVIHHWWNRQTGALTCNEAEYRAAIMALEKLERHGVRQVDLYSDSQILVQQMQGQASVYAPSLRQLHRQLSGMLRQFQQVNFHHLPREQNRVADALANEAADGNVIRSW